MTVSGLSDDQIAKAIAAAREGDAPLSSAPGVGQVADKLPGERSAVLFIDGGQIATSGLNFARAFGQAPPVDVPQNLPPLGLAVGPADDAVQIGAFLPKDLVSAMIVIGMQAQEGGGGGGMGDDDMGGL